ncbi:conserved hypothetical protein [Nitrosopumilaceae archaeon]|nr:conserved hypothetical protein [Nitrosopumilaceae archaeon]
MDRDRVVECMFDPVTSSIIAELEDGPKGIPHLAAAASVGEDEVLERLSYMIECGLVTREGGTLAADHEKLSSIVEESSNFDGAIDGLEKLDTYLN